MKNSVLNFVQTYGKYVFSICLLVLFVFFVRWIGYKGLLGLFLGMVVMAWIFLSKNVLVRWIVSKMRAEEYVESYVQKKGDGR